MSTADDPAFAGAGTPLTATGRSVAYRLPPWRMRGRALAIWYRLTDPGVVRQHIPSYLSVDPDPIVRARFWVLEHDARGPMPTEPGGGRWTAFREAVIAFPVSYASVTGDLPLYMYGDEMTYVSMGREVMGWPVRGATIEVDEEPAAGPPPGATISARMLRDGQVVMSASLTIGEGIEREVRPDPPVWLAEKVIGRVDRPEAAIAQLVATGPERIDRRDIRPAAATLSLGDALGDDLAGLAPREIVRAEHWSGLELTIGWGRVLAELGDGVYRRR